MSADDDDDIAAEARMMCCASCGKSELDDVKLKECTDCKSVRYCSNECKEEHQPEHERKCKEWAAELRDELLFRQPENRHLGDCPICCVPLPIEHEKSALKPCCSKWICKGCAHAHKQRQFEDNNQQTCPFCRHPLPKTIEEFYKIMMKRAEANDPVALCELGERYHDKEDYDGAFENFTKAAELGDVEAHFNLSVMYLKGEGVEKDEKKEIYYAEEAAIRGHLHARYNPGSLEESKGKAERAVKHYTIAANLGHDRSIQELKEYYIHGDVSKEDFAVALRAHHAAVNATKSEQREAAEKADPVAAGLVCDSYLRERQLHETTFLSASSLDE